jgi:hypothetical protein
MMIPQFENASPLLTHYKLISKFQLDIPPAISLLAAEAQDATQLPSGYEPSEYDVVCGRGKGSYNRPGNKRFRALVASRLPEYQAARSKLDKSMLINTIIDEVHALDDGKAQFIKFTKKEGWHKISHEAAREKVGHSIREAAALLKNKPVKEEKKMELVLDQSDLDLLAQPHDLMDLFHSWTNPTSDEVQSFSKRESFLSVSV